MILRPAFVAAAGLVLAACQPPAGAPDRVPSGAAASPVAPTVQAAHAEVARSSELRDEASFADARRGFIAAPEGGQVKSADGQVTWDFDAFRFVQGAAPATVNPSLWRQALLNNHVGLFKVTEGIHQLRGFDLANITLVDGQTGWIVVDTGTSRENAAHAMAFARKHLGPRPVSGVIFTHSHVDHFGGVLGVITAEEARARGVPVVAPAGFMAEATSENVLMGVAMGRRAAYMYGMALPRGAAGKVDDGLGKDTGVGTIGILPPTHVVDREGQEIVIDGRRFVFHDVSHSEAPAEFVFAIPELRAFCGADIMAHTLHNLYTIRGAKVRDALKWVQALDRSLEWAAGAEVVFNQHQWPVWGAERIRDWIEKQRDSYKFIHDQTVRQMNAGRQAAEIAETLTMPPALARFMSVRGYYGTVSHNVKGVFQHYLGWYSGHPADLNPHPPVEAARRYVDLAGGADKVIAHAQAAYDQGDFRWTAEALKHVIYADPANARAAELQARAFEQMGYLAEATTWRNAYLTGAQELRQGPPARGIDPASIRDMLVQTPPERFLERMAASIDGAKAADMAMTINLVFSDSGQSYVLRLADGVLHHRARPPAPEAVATLTLTRAFFVDMMTGRVGARELLLSDQASIDGSRIGLARFLALMEKAPGNFAIVTR